MSDVEEDVEDSEEVEDNKSFFLASHAIISNL